MILNRFFGPIFPGMLFMEPEKATGSGNDLPKPTIEQQLTTAKGDLTAAQTQVEALTKERDTLKSERDSLQSQFDAATTEATNAKTELAKVKGEFETAKTTITNLTGERDSALTNVFRLEKLCGVKGIDPKNAAPIVPEATEDPRAALVSQLSSEKDPIRRNQIANQLRKMDAEAKGK